MKLFTNSRRIIFSMICILLLGACSDNNSLNEVIPDNGNAQQPLNVPCSITIDLNDTGNTRLALAHDGNNLKSTWSKGDQFEIYKNGLCYTFTLDEGCEGKSIGTFTSPTTPPKQDEYNETWYQNNFNFDLYFPSKQGYNNISFKNQIQDGDGNMSHLKDKVTMYHCVGHYTDIRFNNQDYTTEVDFEGFFYPFQIGTQGSLFKKNTIIKIIATNLPVDFQPVSLVIESFCLDHAKVPFLANNAQKSVTYEDGKMEMTLQNFNKDKSFVAYMAQAVHDKSFPAGTTLRLSVTDKDGETYVSDKIIENQKTVTGGKLLTLNYSSGWRKGNNPNYISTDKSKDGTYVKLQSADVPNGINIVFMGDGFSDRQIENGTYASVMNDGYNAFFSEEPFKHFKNYFNVYYVVAISDKEGCPDDAVASSPCTSALETYFGTNTFVAGNNDKVLAYTKKIPALESIDDDHLTSIVMINSTKYAGTCYMSQPNNKSSNYGQGFAIAYFPIGTTYEYLRQVLTHEANGHAFGKLGDEYGPESASTLFTINELKEVEGFGWFTNIDVTDNMREIKWSEFYTGNYITNEKIGAYEGAFTNSTGFFRPTPNSIMRNNTGGFNAPSRKAIYMRIHKMVNGDSWSWEENKNAFLEWDKNNIPTNVSAEMESRRITERTNFVPLAPPVIISK